MDQFDLQYRPRSYFVSETETVLLSRIKGAERRSAVSVLGVENADARTRAESLSRAEREAVSAVHPALMGGEYLPDLELGEVEIARMELRSTTSDVISLRARWVEGSIRYRLVDEYENSLLEEETTNLPIAASHEPLTMADLISQIGHLLRMMMTRIWRLTERSTTTSTSFESPLNTIRSWPPISKRRPTSGVRRSVANWLSITFRIFTDFGVTSVNLGFKHFNDQLLEALSVQSALLTALLVSQAIMIYLLMRMYKLARMSLAMPPASSADQEQRQQDDDTPRVLEFPASIVAQKADAICVKIPRYHSELWVPKSKGQVIDGRLIVDRQWAELQIISSQGFSRD